MDPELAAGTSGIALAFSHPPAQTFASVEETMLTFTMRFLRVGGAEGREQI